MVVVTAGLLGLATAARADESRDAEALIRKGVQLRAQGKDERALPLFERAYQESRTPRTAGQLGLAELAVGYFVEAERYLTEALASPDHPWVSKNLKMLGEQLAAAKEKIGELVITGSPAGAEVSINGKPAGRLPLAAPLRLDKGRVTVELSAPGHVAASDTLTIAGGKRETRAYALAREPVASAPPPTVEKPAAAPPPAAPAPPPPAPAPPVSTSADTPPEHTAAPPSLVVVAPAPAPSMSPARPLAWIAAGGAVAGIALGAVEAYVASSKRDAFNDHTIVVNGAPTFDCATTALTTTCRTLKDDHDSALKLSIVGFVTGGALAVVAATLFVLSTPDIAAAPERSVVQALACAPDPAQRGLTCAVRF